MNTNTKRKPAAQSRRAWLAQAAFLGMGIYPPRITQAAGPNNNKLFSIDVSMLIPLDDCLALDANGWLRVVPGQCTGMPTQRACEEKP